MFRFAVSVLVVAVAGAMLSAAPGRALDQAGVAVVLTTSVKEYDPATPSKATIKCIIVNKSENAVKVPESFPSKAVQLEGGFMELHYSGPPSRAIGPALVMLDAGKEHVVLELVLDEILQPAKGKKWRWDWIKRPAPPISPIYERGDGSKLAKEAEFQVTAEVNGKKVQSNKVVLKVKQPANVKEKLTLNVTANEESRSAEVLAIAFSPDDKQIAAGIHDGTFRLWDAGTGKQIQSYKAFSEGVWSVAFSADGNKLAVFGGELYSGRVQIWDVASAKLVWEKHATDICSGQVLFGADGKTVITTRRNENRYGLTVWNVQAGDIVREQDNQKAGHYHSPLAVSADGTMLAGFDLQREGKPRTTVKIWGFRTGKLLRTLDEIEGYVTGGSFGSGDKTLIVGGEAGIRIWDTQTGELKRRLDTAVRHMAVFKAGALIAVAQGAKVELWDAETGNRLHTWEPLATKVTALAFSSDGRTLAMAGTDGTIKVWKVSGLVPSKNVRIKGGRIQGNDPVAELVRNDISDTERDKLVEQLKKSDASTTATKILKVMRDYATPQEPGIGPKPWLEDRHSHKAKVWYAAGAIWRELFTGKDDPAKVAVLLKLLEDPQHSESRPVVLDVLRVSHWGAEAAKPVAKLLEDRKAADATHLASLRVLLEREGQAYLPQAIDFVEKSPDKAKAERFQRVFEVGNRFFSYQRANQDKIVDLGFRILEAEAKMGPSGGYFVARQLGRFLKVPGKFAPDQKAAKYQGPNGLNDGFFSDTVANALEWRKQHPAADKKK